MRLFLALIHAISLASTPTANIWQPPFLTPHHLVNPYLQPNSDYSSGHRGVDYDSSIGDKVHSPADGQVSLSKTIVNRGVLTVTHPGGLVTEFEPVCSDLKVGDFVQKGAVIATVCQPQDSYLSHCSQKVCLHFSLRLNGQYLSPLAMIGGLNPSRLLPQARG